MNDKVLIKVIVPELDETYDIFIPTNEILWKVKKLIIKAISDLSGNALDTGEEYILINKVTSKVYENNIVVINTDIRNATELILLMVKNN